MVLKIFLTSLFTMIICILIALSTSNKAKIPDWFVGFVTFAFYVSLGGLIVAGFVWIWSS